MHTRQRLSRILMAAWLALAGLVGAAGAAPDRLLHIPSPDWRDQVLYFVMTDRFDDGDPSNNDQGAGEYQPGSDAHYQGGDFAGLRRRLDYIRKLGATGLWITPPVLNQWWNANTRYGGYHGYWAADFTQVDPHLGTLDDYKALSDALHRRGMVLVQDIVLNHTADFFDYRDGWNPRDPAAHWQANEGSRPMPRPTQAPFDRNDPRDPAQRAQAIYHWTPDIRDHAIPQQELNFQLSGLDDLNTENPVVRRALRSSYAYWLREVGVDALRVDTALYVPPALFDDFLHARDAQAPGLLAVARSTGRQDFLTFGEGFAIDKPFETRAAQQIERYVTGPGGRPRMSGMLNFPLYGSLGSVMARGRPTAELAHRIQSMMRVHRDPHRMPSFVDNHDVDRFRAGGSEAALKQALLALMTLPGIPVIYYGTELGLAGQREAMAGRFDTDAPLYRWLQGAIALRRAEPTLSRGRPAVLRADAAGAGVIAWRMNPERGSDRGALLVLMNTAERETLLDALPTGATGAADLPLVYALDGQPLAARTGADGRLTLRLPARSGYVLRLPPAKAPAIYARTALTLDRLLPQADGRVRAQGRAAPGQALQVLLNGDLAQPAAAVADANGRWQAELDTRALVDPRISHRVLAWDPATQQASPAKALRLQRRWQLLADQPDPAGDDHGPQGSGLALQYPTDPSWGANRQMDLRRVRVWAAGDALKIEVDTQRLTRSWNPPNGFDHVAFTLFIGQPGRDGGATVMPLQDGSLPNGMRWHWRLRASGWSSALFSADGASDSHEGTALARGASLAVDPVRQRVTFTLPGGLLGDLDGAQLYVSSWDYDGGYRALGPQPGGHSMGGGPGPKVMDDVGPITLRAPGLR